MEAFPGGSSEKLRFENRQEPCVRPFFVSQLQNNNSTSQSFCLCSLHFLSGGFFFDRSRPTYEDLLQWLLFLFNEFVLNSVLYCIEHANSAMYSIYPRKNWFNKMFVTIFRASPIEIGNIKYFFNCVSKNALSSDRFVTSSRTNDAESGKRWWKIIFSIPDTGQATKKSEIWNLLSFLSQCFHRWLFPHKTKQTIVAN